MCVTLDTINVCVTVHTLTPVCVTVYTLTPVCDTVQCIPLYSPLACTPKPRAQFEAMAIECLGQGISVPVLPSAHHQGLGHPTPFLWPCMMYFTDTAYTVQSVYILFTCTAFQNPGLAGLGHFPTPYLHFMSVQEF